MTACQYPHLEKLEDEHISFLKERSDMIAQRRRADDEDDLSLFLGSLPQAPDAEEVDELGRVIPQANSTAARRDRRAARSARHNRRQARAPAHQTEVEEGYSTDSSLPPSDAADYQTAMQRLRADQKELMADVKAEEFKSPENGLSRWFGGWRTKFGESYTGAWGGLGMVSAWEFWTRYEILGWNPLEVCVLGASRSARADDHPPIRI